MTMPALLLMLLLSGPIYVSDEPRPPSVSVGAGKDGTLVSGPKGRALYTYDGVDRGDYCSNSPCRDNWPILEAAATDKAVGEWSPYSAGGRRIWLYKGKPVFTFIGDMDPGQAKGDGLGGDWHALHYIGATPRVPAPPSVKVSKVGSAFVLTDYRRHTLYTFARDGHAPACKAECLDVWQPLPAPMLAAAVGEWTVVERPDALRQWAYRGRLVYTFSEDLAPLQANGAGVGGVWQTIPVTERDATVATALHAAGRSAGARGDLKKRGG